jgi:hypothetical protein
VGAALTVRRLDADPRGLVQAIQATIAVVDRVHHDGQLPLIPVTWRSLAPGTFGAYDTRTFGEVEVPSRIVLDPMAPRPRLTLLYEIGHFLDHQALGDRNVFASVGHSNLDEWRGVVRETRAVQRLSFLQRSDPAPSLRRHIQDYANTYVELWERSYAQYVAGRSADPALRPELDEARQRRPRGEYLPYHWDGDDFAPVATAIDDVFRRLGWIGQT